jgi:hypothetical protein
MASSASCLREACWARKASSRELPCKHGPPSVGQSAPAAAAERPPMLVEPAPWPRVCGACGLGPGASPWRVPARAQADAGRAWSTWQVKPVDSVREIIRQFCLAPWSCNLPLGQPAEASGHKGTPCAADPARNGILPICTPVWSPVTHLPPGPGIFRCAGRACARDSFFLKDGHHAVHQRVHKPARVKGAGNVRGTVTH